MTTVSSNSIECLTLTPIGHIHTDFSSKFGIPRQSGLTDLLSRLTFEPEFQNQDCFRGIEEYSHLWLLWEFSENKEHGWSPTVRPPRLGGNIRKGVFATRSPFRPNPVGLSCVRLVRFDPDTPDGPVLVVSGADLMDKTPIYDIKPYVPYADSHPNALGGFSKNPSEHRLNVHLEKSLFAMIPSQKQAALLELLALDPRPSYHTDEKRIYGMEFSGYNVQFYVKDMDLYLVDIQTI